MIQVSEKIVAAIRSVLGAGNFRLHEPIFCETDKNYVLDSIDSTFVSSVGKYVDQFEHQLAEFTGVRRAVAVSNGTSALHVALQMAGVRPNEEVIIPTLTFVATGNAVKYLGALPHFVDSNEQTLGIDPVALRDWLTKTAEYTCGGFRNRETGRRLRAIVPMHTFGHPCDLDGLVAVAHDFGLALIEDAAEGLGSKYFGSHVGSFGLLGILSFNGNKIITTGGGGAILTNDESIADHAKHITTTAKIPHRWNYEHDEVGYNFRMPNLNAALGCAQMEQLNDFIAAKRKLFELYQEAFLDIGEVELMSEPENCRSNYWLQTVVLSKAVMHHRNSILKTTNDAGLMTRPAWSLLNELSFFQDCPKAPLPISKLLSERIINIPSGAGLVR